ncbi:hypothetical protein [Defluviitalea saccharophila]|uniref:AP2/ERF domain-containing protein n=1 Tax=Defluviitalea saccharophila TaxID=879970 RepID=A0ABZ2Y832_9FIRM
MEKLTGVFKAYKKNGEAYYRSSITYKNKHISLGSFDTPELAHKAYLEAYEVLFNKTSTLSSYSKDHMLSFEKWVIIHNFRDNGYYFGNPIYLHKYYFSYYLDPHTELKFDADDLFYYASHKIHRKNGYFFVNDYGVQQNILNRYGIRNFAVKGRDYRFKNGDYHDFRHYNIEVINPYHGVCKEFRKNKLVYVTRINIYGTWTVGVYSSPVKAAIAYNKAVDFVVSNGISSKNYVKNYIEELDSTQYQEIYAAIKISKKLRSLARDKSN